MKCIKILFIVSVLLNVYFSMAPVLRSYRSKIALVGDSNTESFQLKSSMSYIVINEGVSGFTSHDLKKYVGKVMRQNPNKIFIQIGINDLDQGLTADSVLTNFKDIILNIKAENSNILIYAVSLFPTGGKYSSLNHTIVTYNLILKNYCQTENIHFIDMYAPLLKGNEINKTYSLDGLHLTDQGYQIWTNSLTAYLVN